MGTSEPDKALKRELDDSGCVQDESPPLKKCIDSNGYVGQAQLLDLSDDVLLYILRYCTPMDLKALGYSCPRLGTLIRDRSLWQRVDARGSATGRQRLAWMLVNTLHRGTEALMLEGYANVYPGCQGQSSKSEMEETNSYEDGASSSSCSAGPSNETQRGRDSPYPVGGDPPYPLHRQHARMDIHAHLLPRFSASPTWHEDMEPCTPVPRSPSDTSCPGPMFTITPSLLIRLSVVCPFLTELTLDGCNINCQTITINQLPSKLKKLSLKGTKCFNMPMDKSFLFKIQDYLPVLEELDLSQCEWMEPSSLLPLSKMRALQVLKMRNCYKMSEFVAYASLATRYGFKTLRDLDLRGCPVSDSEVSALGWLHNLTHVQLSVCHQPADEQHQHSKRVKGKHCELTHWERQEPGYFNSCGPLLYSDKDMRCCTVHEDINKQMMMMKRKLRPSDCSSNGDPEPDTGSSSNGNTPETKPKTKQEDDDQEDGTKKYTLRSRRKTAENDSEAHDKPGPSKRKRSNSADDTNDTKKGIKHVSIKRERETRSGNTSAKIYFKAEKVKTKAEDVDSKNSESVPKGTPKKADDNSKKTDDNSKNKGENSTPQTVRVTRSNAKTIETPNKQDTTNEKTSCSKIKETPKGKLGPNDTPKGKSSRNKPSKGDTSEVKSSPNDNPKGKSTKTSKLETTPLRKSLRNQSKQNSKDTETPKSDLNDNNSAKKPNKKTENTTNDSNKKTETSSKYNKRKAENADKDQDDTTPKRPAYMTRKAVNEGASTSKNDSNDDKNSSDTSKKASGKSNADKSQDTSKNTESDSSDSDDDDSNQQNNGIQPVQDESQFIRFRMSDGYYGCRLRQNCPPELFRLPFVPNRDEAEERLPLPPPPPEDRVCEQGHHLLYVNVGERFHAVYRLAPNRPAFGGNRSRARVSNLRQMFTAPTFHVEPTSMVTDAAVRGFGRSEADDMNYVLIGPNGIRAPREGPVYNRLIGPGGQNLTPTQRPDRVTLQSLSITGFTTITDRSLIHLVEAAPHLRHIDFRGTSVTEQGVENFKALRPECEVLYGPIKKEETSE